MTTKIHAVVDALGNPLRFILSPGQVSDITQAEALIAGLPAEHVLGDKGYDARSLRDAITEQGAAPVMWQRRCLGSSARRSLHRTRVWRRAPAAQRSLMLTPTYSSAGAERSIGGSAGSLLRGASAEPSLRRCCSQ